MIYCIEGFVQVGISRADRSQHGLPASCVTIRLSLLRCSVVAPFATSLSSLASSLARLLARSGPRNLPVAGLAHLPVAGLAHLPVAGLARLPVAASLALRSLSIRCDDWSESNVYLARRGCRLLASSQLDLRSLPALRSGLARFGQVAAFTAADQFRVVPVPLPEPLPLVSTAAAAFARLANVSAAKLARCFARFARVLQRALLRRLVGLPVPCLVTSSAQLFAVPPHSCPRASRL